MVDTIVDEVEPTRIVLFGSQSKTTSSLPFRAQARGDTHKESDVDVFVVLERPVEPSPEIRRMRDIRTRFGLQARACPLSSSGLQDGVPKPIVDMALESS
jgi:predicted nucleotidyltransferase